jgi:pimeloyl-ACP methyl ester carboxylesterase
MRINTTHQNPAGTDVEPRCTESSVTSRDGTTIGYRQLGQGPGLVVLHGAMSSGYNHLQLARLLSDSFTIYLPDRRGRGLSSPYGDEYHMAKEVEDVHALLSKTGAHNLFGVSSGAIIGLQAARTLPAVQKAAIFEPPFFADVATPKAFLKLFDAELAQGKVAAALATAMQATKMGPPLLGAMPHWLLARLSAMMMAGEAKTAGSDYIPMSKLAPTLHYDAQLIIEMSETVDSFGTIPAEVLLLGGSKSPRYLKQALDRMQKVLPDARRVELPGVGHAASWNSDRGGQPLPVATALRQFFT